MLTARQVLLACGFWNEKPRDTGRRGANVDAASDVGWTALMVAAMGNSPDERRACARLLLEAGADASLVTKRGDTALSLATRRNDELLA